MESEDIGIFFIYRRRRYLHSTLYALRSALFLLIVPQIIGEIKKSKAKKERTAVKLSVFAYCRPCS